jgi:hypothetical protein
MRKRRFVPCAFAALLVLSACAEVGKLTVTDLTNAAQVATRAGDLQGAACWVALTPVANAVEAAPAPSLASVIETDRLFAAATQGPNAPCNAVGGLILSMLLGLCRFCRKRGYSARPSSSRRACRPGPATSERLRSFQR